MIGKRKGIFVFILLIIVLPPAIFMAYYHFNNRLFLIEAELLWGAAPFKETEFRYGSTAVKSSMVVDLIKSGKYIGEKCDSIPEALGEETGDYYHSDSNSTYKLSDHLSANWILTFICGETGTIERIIIRKSCCSTSQELLYWVSSLVIHLKSFHQ